MHDRKRQNSEKLSGDDPYFLVSYQGHHALNEILADRLDLRKIVNTLVSAKGSISDWKLVAIVVKF